MTGCLGNKKQKQTKQQKYNNKMMIKGNEWKVQDNQRKSKEIKTNEWQSLEINENWTKVQDLKKKSHKMCERNKTKCKR